MATQNERRSNSKKPAPRKSDTEYKFLKFNSSTIDVIRAYGLDQEQRYNSLITQFQRIDNLLDTDPRKAKLIELWEEQFNSVFRNYWNRNILKTNQNSGNKIAGWKDRLNIKPQSINPEDLRLQLARRLSTGSGYKTTSDSREDILSRASARANANSINNNDSQSRFSYTVNSDKSPASETYQSFEKNNDELNNMLFLADKKTPDSLLNNDESDGRDYSVAQGFTIQSINPEERVTRSDSTSQMMQNVNDNSFYAKVNLPDADEEDSDSSVSKIFDTDKLLDLTDEELIHNDSKVQSNRTKPLYSKGEMNAEPSAAANDNPTAQVEAINPLKRNVVSKDGFEYFDPKNDDKRDNYSAFLNASENDEQKTLPYHEIKPVGNYSIIYDKNKWPSLNDVVENERQKSEAIDELQEKIEFLKDLRAERRHRISLVRHERTNSYIIARARRMYELREKRRQKRLGDEQVRLLVRQERIRRLNERQRLVQLLKERQMKRAEEKRVSTLLRLERERRLQREAEYRNEISNLDAQINREQENIQKINLKMKSYFTKINDEKLFDNSIEVGKNNSKYSVAAMKFQRIKELDEMKRANRIEKISWKFNKIKK